MDPRKRNGCRPLLLVLDYSDGMGRNAEVTGPVFVPRREHGSAA